LKQATGCKIAVHEAETKEVETLGPWTRVPELGLKFKPAKVDMSLRDGQHVQAGNVDFEIIHTPGHSPGGICILFKEGDKVNLFTGDIAQVGGRMGWMGPDSDLNEWKRSVKILVERKPDRIFPSHGTFLLSGAANHLKVLDTRMNAPWWGWTIITSADRPP